MLSRSVAVAAAADCGFFIRSNQGTFLKRRPGRGTSEIKWMEMGMKIEDKVISLLTGVVLQGLCNSMIRAVS